MQTTSGRFDLEAELTKARLLAHVLGVPERASVRLGRFAVLRCIGRGGMGKVFEARDCETDARLALKTLHDAHEDAIARIKREFRALSSLAHPNLVAMSELHLADGLPFFTMELVDGAALSERLREGPRVDVELIRSCLLQLVDVLQAIHHSGTVHGDIKPSNLLLRRDGRLILVDFGVARALGEARLGPASGTSAYMAPERARGGRAEAPSDWYAVGALLQALLVRASTREQHAFSALCAGLLDPEPRSRFGAREIQSAFGDSPARVLTTHTEPDVFVARATELQALHGAFDAAAHGPSICVISGDPGLGKTALAEHFLGGLDAQDALVLRGRCFEHEALPYKGFDGIMEALAMHTGALPEPDAELCHVFPAWRRVVSPTQTARDPRAIRRAAFDALSTWFSTLSQQRRLVLFLDDLQWADADGAALIERLLLGAERPRLLLIACQRAGESGPGVTALHTARSRCVHVTVSLAPLCADACSELAQRLTADALDRGTRAQLVQESGGNPLLLRALLASGEHTGARTYEALVTATLARLEPEARELLQLTVLAGRPVPPALLRMAAGSQEHPWKLIAALRNARLLRTSTRAGQLSLLPHHDRVSEVIANALSSDERRARHAALARAAERLKLDDPELLADQHLRAGAARSAAPYLEQAGDRARAAAALQRACDHYARALACHGEARPLGCVRKLADACAAVGDMARAAPLYLEAAAGARDAVPLQLKAAEMYLLSGADATGMKLLRPALREAGIWLPSSALGALALGVWSLARIHFAPKPCAHVATMDQRAEIAFRLGYSIAMMHPRHGAALLLWSGARALRLGSPAQRGCALVHTAYVYTLLGLGSASAQDARVCEALTLSRDDKVSHAFVLCGDAMVSFARADCRATLRKCALADAYIRTARVEEHWLLTQLQTVVVSVRVLSGDFVQLDALAAQLEAEAAELGNRPVVAQAQSARAWASLLRGDTAPMRAFALSARATWHAARLSTLYGLAIWGECHRLLYEGEPHAALALMHEEAPRFARSSLARTQPWSVAITLLWASIRLACSARPRDAHWRAAERLCLRLERERSQWGAPGAALIRAGLARRLGQRERARLQLTAARAGFERLGMQGYAAAADYRASELLSDSPSAAREAAPWFRAQAVAEPAHWVRMYAP